MTTWNISVATEAARRSSRTSWCGFWPSRACYRSSWMPSSKPSSACTGAQPCCWPSSTCLISWTSRLIGTRHMMQIWITPGRKTACSCAPGWTRSRTDRSYSTKFVLIFLKISIRKYSAINIPLTIFFPKNQMTKFSINKPSLKKWVTSKYS